MRRSSLRYRAAVSGSRLMMPSMPSTGSLANQPPLFPLYSCLSCQMSEFLFSAAIMSSVRSESIRAE